MNKKTIIPTMRIKLLCMYYALRLIIKNELIEHSSKCCIVCAFLFFLSVVIAIAWPPAIFFSGVAFVLCLLFWSTENF